jgi:hypothetical protein
METQPLPCSEKVLEIEDISKCKIKQQNSVKLAGEYLDDFVFSDKTLKAQ